MKPEVGRTIVDLASQKEVWVIASKKEAVGQGHLWLERFSSYLSQ
jgi:hypothetical protein